MGMMTRRRRGQTSTSPRHRRNHPRCLRAQITHQNGQRTDIGFETAQAAKWARGCRGISCMYACDGRRTVSDASRVAVRRLQVALRLRRRLLDLKREEVAARERRAQRLALRRMVQILHDRTRPTEPRRGVGVGAVVDDAERGGVAATADLVVLPLEVARSNRMRWRGRRNTELLLRHSPGRR
jgi:hypothetical protein